MAFSGSGVFASMVADTWAGTAVFDLDSPSDTYKMSAWNNTVAPDKDATSANSKYNGGTWLIANEIIDTLNTNWIAHGRSITGMTVTRPTTNVIMVDCNDVSGAGNVTMAGFYGTLVDDDTKTTPVADQAVCFNYLGGTQTITNGPINIVIDANGLFRATV